MDAPSHSSDRRVEARQGGRTSYVRVDAIRDSFPRVVKALGGSPERMLAAEGLSSDLLSQRDGVLKYRTMMDLFERASVELDCPDFGLRLARSTPEGMAVLGPLLGKGHGSDSAEGAKSRDTTIGCTSSVVASVSTLGGSVQVIDYQWEAGASIVDRHADVGLRLRLWPLKLRVRGWVEPGQEAAFGPLMMMPSNVATYGRGTDTRESVRTVVCRFDRRWLSETAEHESEWNSADPASCLNLRDLNIEHAMRRLGTELLEPGQSSGTLLQSLFVELGIDTARTMIKQSAGHTLADGRGTLSKAKLQRIQEYIRSYPNGSPTLALVAAECGFSVAHLRRVFKKSTGRTVYDYIEDIRIERAQQLLLETDLRLKTISYQLGFSHPSAFSFAFKKATGESPGDYRARYSATVTEPEGGLGSDVERRPACLVPA